MPGFISMLCTTVPSGMLRSGRALPGLIGASMPLCTSAPALTPRYWRTKGGKEVDFVLDHKAAGLLAVECKWSEASIGKLRGLKAFTRAYPGAEAVIVVPTLRREYTVGLGEHEATVTDLDGLVRRALVLPE